MDLIVTHTSGDFDSLASLIAAKKLYPQAEIILPRTPEKQVRKFLSLYKDVFDIRDERYFDFSKVKRLIIVDTSLKRRIGNAAACLRNKNIELHIYDHHPPTSDDIKAHKESRERLGATVTILLKEIIKKKIKLTPLEATLIGLGIYEDTGCLTFRTTTKQDIDMVSYLFERGLNLNLLSHYLNRQLTEEELNLLVKLINHTKTFSISGVNIAITAVKHKGYIPDLAILTHRLIDIENFNVIFVLVKIGTKIQMIARSRLPNINVDEIASIFGGGGHASASSGIIRNHSLSKVQKKIINTIKKNLKPEPRAKDIMSYPVKTLDIDDTIDEAYNLMSKFNIGGLPIMHNKKLAGIITRQDVDKAIFHKLGHSRIKGYMTKNVISLSPEARLNDIQKAIFENDIGRIPIIKKSNLAGIVTRGDILRVLHKNLGHSLTKTSNQKKKPVEKNPFVNLSEVMKSNLPLKVYRLLKKISAAADKAGYRLYAVGGFVRDLILRYPNLDIDLVVETQAIEFAKTLQQKLNCRLVVHKRFGTAILIMKDGFRIDLATSRTEFYEYPAALPTVQFSNIKNDLLRRDFTINSMAIGLNKDNFGELIDFYGGQKDIKEKKIKVLHNLSFVEDPTRIFRAVKFEQRYNFQIDSQTESLIKTAVDMDMFLKVAGERIRDELIPILSEEKPLKGIKRMQQLHELRFIHPKIRLNKNILDSFKRAKNILKKIEQSKTPHKRWVIYFMLLTESLKKNELKNVAKRLVFSNKDAAALMWYNTHSSKIIKKLSIKPKAKIKPSQVYKLLKQAPYESLIAVMAKAPQRNVKECIKRYLFNYCSRKLKVKGSDLKKLGLKPSPKYSKIMDELFYRKLDKNLKTKKDELAELTRILNSNFKR
jgi:tRNA nucleotidyltransferase (CCA-adding enzyme)